jgi:hypothetical protein
MNAITYQPTPKAIRVLLDGKPVGWIFKNLQPEGYRYSPKGTRMQSWGPILPTIDDVKRSIEGAGEATS